MNKYEWYSPQEHYPMSKKAFKKHTNPSESTEGLSHPTIIIVLKNYTLCCGWFQNNKYIGDGSNGTGTYDADNVLMWRYHLPFGRFSAHAVVNLNLLLDVQLEECIPIFMNDGVRL
jgi:hypothetical protein